MSQLEYGYLSDEHPDWTQAIRSVHVSWFELAENLSQLGMKILTAVHPKQGDQAGLLIALLHGRGLQSLQGGIVLAERGLAGDSCSLARSILEDAFCAGALLRNPTQYVQKMVGQYQRHRGATARKLGSMLNVPEDVISESHRQKLNEVVKETSGYSEQWNWDQVANDAEMGAVYDILYRPLSAEASHPTLGSLMRHIEATPAGEIIDLKWFPHPERVDEALSYLCNAYLFLAETTSLMFKLEDERQQVAAANKRFGVVYASHPPASR